MSDNEEVQMKAGGFKVLFSTFAKKLQNLNGK